MKVEDLVRISYRDLAQKKRKFRIFEISLMVGVLCLLLFGMLSDGVVDYVTKEMNKKSEYKVVSLNGYKDREKIVSFVKKMDEVIGVCEESQIEDVKAVFVDDQEVILSTIRSVAPDMDSFYAVNEKQVDKPIIAGRDLQKGDVNKALLDEYAVLSLGYEDATSVLGKTIKMQVNSKEISVEIVGVFSLNLSENREEVGNIYKDDAGRIDIGVLPIVITANSVEEVMDESETYMHISVEELTSVSEVVKKIQSYVECEVYAEIEMIGSLLMDFGKIKKILQVISYALLTISFFTIISVLYVVIEGNRKWYEMLNILGYEKRVIKCINGIEVSIITLRAIWMAALLGFVGTIILNNLIYRAIGELYMFAFPFMMLLTLSGGILVVNNMVSLILTNKVLRNGVEDGKKK